MIQFDLIAVKDVRKVGCGWRHGLGIIGYEEFHVSLLLNRSRAQPLPQVRTLLDVVLPLSISVPRVSSVVSTGHYNLLS
jgi:hypothetical protein